ncbi:MAG: alpha/beta hydrolase, partial [Leptonema sp. (in: Bacteria)]|nr:alpha/beta hydrolase [Leptonema sp. (in: bacteria)]
MVLFRYFFLYAIFLSFVVSCQSVNDVSANQFKCYNFEPGWQKDQKVNDVFYDVYVPPKPKDATSCQRVVLVLPGWKFPRTDWPKKSDIIDIANQYQAILVMPEMYTSIYESDYYNETVMKWNEIPGGQFIKEQFLPALQKKGYFLKGYQN